MNINQLKDTIKIGYETKVPVLALSSPGIGKSAAVHQCREELGKKYRKKLGLIEIHGANLSPAEIADVKYVKADQVANATQEWLPTDERVKEGLMPARGIISLEEIAAALPSVQSSLQRLLLDRQLGSLKLAKEWYVTGNANRVQDRAASNPLSTALINRVIVTQVEPDPDEVFAYGLKHKFYPSTLAYMRFRPQCLTDFDPSKKTDNPAFCSPRSLERLSMVCNQVHTQRTDPWMLELYSGVIGDGCGAEFYSFLKIEDDLPDIGELIKSPDSYAIPTEASIQYALIGALNTRANKKTVEPIMTYLNRMPPEISTVAVMDLMQICPELPKTAAYKKWAVANAAYLI